MASSFQSRQLAAQRRLEQMQPGGQLKHSCRAGRCTQWTMCWSNISAGSYGNTMTRVPQGAWRPFLGKICAAAFQHWAPCAKGHGLHDSVDQYLNSEYCCRTLLRAEHGHDEGAARVHGCVAGSFRNSLWHNTLQLSCCEWWGRGDSGVQERLPQEATVATNWHRDCSACREKTRWEKGKENLTLEVHRPCEKNASVAASETVMVSLWKQGPEVGELVLDMVCGLQGMPVTANPSMRSFRCTWEAGGKKEQNYSINCGKKGGRSGVLESKVLMSSQCQKPSLQ